jgi:hypothetical protein
VIIDDSTLKPTSSTGLHILYRTIAGDAFHDAAERFPQPRCHPDTRTKMLDVLWNWACGTEPPGRWTYHDPDPDSQDSVRISGVLWLYGPAGSGKSAIAQSFCQKLKEEGRLGASFFFKRGSSSRGNAKKLFPTVAYQLALLHPEFKQVVSKILDDDPAIVDRSLSHQLEELIIKPCRRVSFFRPVPIIIDGLDECEGEHIQQEILRSIFNEIWREHLPILFLIASRPETHIREMFADSGLNGFHRSLNINQSFEDVRKYLLDEFTRIYGEREATMAGVPPAWPSSEIVEELVEKSSGYFIYVSTVVKFIDDKRFRPVDRLNAILGIKHNVSASPFDPLDRLYHQILSDVPLILRPQLLKVLTIIKAQFGLTLTQIEELLELETGDLRLILRGLHSVINVPEQDDVGVLSVHHASFLDYLDNSTRSGPFYLGSEARTALCRNLLQVCSYGYGARLENKSQHVAW